MTEDKWTNDWDTVRIKNPFDNRATIERRMRNTFSPECAKKINIGYATMDGDATTVHSESKNRVRLETTANGIAHAYKMRILCVDEATNNGRRTTK